MSPISPMLQRLVDNWVYGGFLAGILLLALLPLFLAGWPLPLSLTVLMLPIYMLHQFEEHDAGRFGRFVNAELGNGRVVLTAPAIFVVNIVLVWALFAAAIWLAARVHVGFGLIAAYTVLLNAGLHIAQAIGMRRYNPGLVTAVVLFLPLSAWAIWALSMASGVGVVHHAIGVAVAVLGHAAVVGIVLVRRARAPLSPAPGAS